MNFSDYDRISDTLMFFNNDTVLEFVVTFSSRDKNGNRIFFHMECDYDSNKYIGVDKGHSIKRRMSFYFAINDRKAFDRSFIIRPEDAMMLTMLIESQILPWYFDQKRKIFSIVEGQLKIIGKYQDIVFAKNEYSYLRFVPCVYTFNDNTFKEGIRMYVSSDSAYVDMEIDKFMGLYYYISRTDMYGAACSLATYAKVAPYGINNYNPSGLSGAGKSQLDYSDNFLPDNSVGMNDVRNKQINDFFNKVVKKKKSKK